MRPWLGVCKGYWPDGSEKPFSVLAFAVSTPPNEPIIIGICSASPSVKNPTTCVPGSNPVPLSPIPDIAAELTGCMVTAHGKSSVGKTALSSVW